MDAANKIKDKGLARKLTTAVVGAIVLLSAGLVIIAAVVFTDIKATMKEVLYDVTLDSYKSVISSEVQSAISITENYYELAQSGGLSEAEAQKKAMEVIRSIRYGDDNSGYLWIDGTDYTLLMHPILPDQEGNNRYELTDQNDVKIIQEIMKVAKEGGYNEFYFTKSDGVTVAPKVAYSKEFEPWNWVITTGVYSDDIQNIVDNSNGVIQIGQIFNQSLGLMAGMAALFAVIIAIVAYILIKKIILVIDKVKVQLTRVAQGDLTGKLKGRISQRNDELGAMVRNTNIAMDSFRSSMLSVKNTTDAVESGSTDMKEKTENAVNANEQVATAIGNVAAEVSQQASAVDQMIENVASLADAGKAVSTAVEEALQYMKQLDGNSADMKAKMESMSEESAHMDVNVQEISEKIDVTSKGIQEMETILGSIEEIASETNLLALNASIEAARAGDAGRGFAVVADSIKGLSENTSNELENIRKIISTLVENFKECEKCIELVVKSNQSSTESTKDVIESFRIINNDVVSTNEKLTVVHETDEKMMKDIMEIDSQVKVIGQAAESNAAATQEITASSEELTALLTNISSTCNSMTGYVDNLVKDMNQFKVEE
ncbi:putative methyl-accepting chemotaxis protein signaling domain protein [Roseburia sp. CAG:100]|jgi:methyl-accepting chemotaxis protein|nr:putative methyl-accepting chemotaxis protein signaling domain protein [Roseburia sp. CAG:100]